MIEMTYRKYCSYLEELGAKIESGEITEDEANELESKVIITREWIKDSYFLPPLSDEVIKELSLASVPDIL